MFNVKSIPTLPIGIHCYERGVYLRVTTHSRSWLYKYQLNGKRRELGLGSATQPLSAVLAKVAPLKALVAQGIDPKDQIAKEKAEKKAAEVKSSMPTFSEYVDHAFEKILYLRGFTGAKTEAAWRCDIDKLKEAFGKQRLDAITRDDVAAFLRQWWTTKPRRGED
ncbi:MAG: integrase arm-type DNA-binding domain-containing protein, partial [Sutterella wadsworthensis]